MFFLNNLYFCHFLKIGKKKKKKSSVFVVFGEVRLFWQ